MYVIIIKGSGRALPNGPCDVGWFCPPGMTEPQPTGNRCLPGHQCPLGSASQTPCYSGTYQPDPGMGFCFECPAGKCQKFLFNIILNNFWMSSVSICHY